MPRVATIVPEETDLLCEGCGYTLNGLPGAGNCPECGKPIGQSVGEHRHFSAFEDSPSKGTFIQTTLAVIFSPREFYSNLATRNVTRAAVNFYDLHLFLSSVLFAFTGYGHALWIIHLLSTGTRMPTTLHILSIVVMSVLVFGLMTGLTRLAAWLSALEGRYWGMRLPHPVVLRGMRFHAANYLPVGLLAVALVWGYRLLRSRGVLTQQHDDIYLYSLCAAVILSAGFLFRSYWIAMKSMMFANR